MFQHIYAQRELRRAGVSISEIADRNMMGYAEALETVRHGGALAPNDPRKNLDASEIRSLSELKNNELMSMYGTLAASMFHDPKDRDKRIQGAAALRAQRLALSKAASDPSKQAQIAEKSALALASSYPDNKTAREMLVVAAAMSDQAQRQRATLGFDSKNGKGNIAKAAKAQGRSWLEVRDDLVKFNVLPQNDPRRRILPADIDQQKGRALSARQIVPAEELENMAMKELKKDPGNQQAMAWLATTGALYGAKEAKQVKGHLPKRKSAFGRLVDHQI